MNNEFIIEDGILKSYKGNSKEIIIPDNVKSIGYQAFYNNNNITKVIMPKSVEEIRWSAFGNCVNLEKIILNKELKVIAPNSTARAHGIFIGCNKLKTVGPIGSNSNIEYEWEDAIPDSAFYGSEIESIFVNEKINKIGEYALYGTYTGYYDEKGTYIFKPLNVVLPINCKLEKKALDKNNTKINFSQSVKISNKISSDYLLYDNTIAERFDDEEISWVFWYQSKKWKEAVLATVRAENVLNILDTIYKIGRANKKISKTNVEYVLKIIKKIKDEYYYKIENKKFIEFLNEINYK